MEKLRVQRLVKVWVEDIYHVEKITPEIIKKAINHEIIADDFDEFWDTSIELGDYDVFDVERNLISYSRHE